MDLTRRKTVLGLGLLATGSGAAFTNAAFNDSVSPSSDLRVVVEDSAQLVVEPGIIFRDGDSAKDPFDPSSTSYRTNVYDNDGFSGNGTELFGGNGNSGLEDISFGDVVAASANDAQNDKLELEVAVPLNDDRQLGNPSVGWLQIRNESSDPQDIGIRFERFGADTNGSQDGRGGDVSEEDVVDIFKLKEEKMKPEFRLIVSVLM